jgi:hypothetical protein
MNTNLQERYMNILNKQVEEGLDILERMTVKDKNYQAVVVNINNANNISFQLKTQIENDKAAELAKAKAEADKILTEVKPETAAKRKYTKKAK